MLHLSDRYLARSSIPSLTTETITTKMKGTQALIGANGLIEGNRARMQITRKYTFAKRLN
mgnify:CR=1 FL=1